MRILYQIKKNGQKIGHHVSNKEFRLFRFLQVQVHAYEDGEFQLEIQIKTHNFAFPECLTVPHSGRTGSSSVRSRQSESVQSCPAHYIRSRGFVESLNVFVTVCVCRGYRDSQIYHTVTPIHEIEFELQSVSTK